MNGLPFIAPTPVLIEINQDTIRLVEGDRSLDSPLERLSSGRLAAACRDRLEAQWREFLHLKPWQPRPRAFCAIGARGVSLRRLTLPAAPPEQRQRLLRLQIESEFPLPPEQLAWGTLRLNGQPTAVASDPNATEILVFAVRRELIEDYRTLFVACGLNPVFTLAALARARLRPPTRERWALLDVQRRDAELVVFTEGGPSAIHCLTWGSETLAETPGVPLPDVSQLGSRLGLSGAFLQDRGVDDPTPVITRAVGTAITVEPLRLAPGNPRSAALQGLQTLLEHGRTPPPMTFAVDSDSTQPTSLSGWLGRWAIAAGALLLGCLLLRFVETSLHRSRLERAIEQVRNYRESLPLIDQQLGFLQHLDTNRPPYLRVLATVAQAASPGLQLESISLNRRGDLLLRGTLQGQQPPTDFRTKLVESGAFTSVVLEEQNPGQDQQKITFRIAARWDPERLRDLPDLPPVEPMPAGVGPPGMRSRGFSSPALPLPPGGLPPGITLPPGFTPPGEMPAGLVVSPQSAPAEGGPVFPQVEAQTP